MAIFTLQYISESQDKSDLDKNFKMKTNKSFKFIDLASNFNEAKKYMEKDSVLSKNIDYIKKARIGEIAIDTSSDKLAGYIFVVRTTGNIQPIHVFESYRGYGLGNSLLKDGIDKYNARQLNVYSDNLVAIKLYKKFGFKEVYRKSYKDGTEYIHMERSK